MARPVCPLTTESHCHYHRANLVWATGLFINDATGQLPQMKCAISINTIGVAHVTKGVASVTNAAFVFHAERPARKIRNSLPPSHPQLEEVT